MRARPVTIIIRRLALVLGLLEITGLVGCASFILPNRDHLPDDPIAVRYWEPEDARKRAELISESLDPRSALAPLREGVAQVQGISTFLGLGQSEALTQKLARYPGRLGLLDPKTGEIERLEAAPVNARPLAWSDDHKRLLFESAHIGERPQIYEYDFESETLRTLTRGPDLHLIADYGPNGRIAVTRISNSRDDSDASVVLTGEDAAGVESTIEGLFPSSLQWSPDGRRLVYEKLVRRRSGSGYDSVIGIREVGGDEKIIGRGKEPTLSRDGVWVVYAAQSTKGLRLRRMRVDGSARAPVGTSARDERMPAISPDGRHVAYVADEAGLHLLYVRDFDGSKDLVLRSEGSVEFPVW